MKIAIHSRKGSFSDRWIDYCEKHGINYKVVNLYHYDVIEQIADCDAIMWHFNHLSPRDFLFAKQLIQSLELTGKSVFPDYRTSWHFDDKVGQKYLLEVIGAPLLPTWVFYERSEALKWTKETKFPKVFKLRSGAGSRNVRLVKSGKEARRLINKAFSLGFPSYSASASIKERWRKYKLNKTNFKDLLKGLARFVIPPDFSKIRGRIKGYIYFQEFLPGKDHDVRVVVIGTKAFAIKRMVRDNDFRASGSGEIYYDRTLFDEKVIRLAFNLTKKMKCQCLAFDFLEGNGDFLVTEMSYGFSPEGYDPCPGYWDIDLKWHEGKFNPYGWMVEDLINETKLARHNDKS